MKKLAALGILFGASCVSGHQEPEAIGFSPTNVDPEALELGALGDIVIEDPGCTADTSTGYIDCLGVDDPRLRYMLVTQSDGSRVAVFAARSFRIEQTAQLDVRGAYPIVLLALDRIDVIGGLAAAANYEEGNGGGFTAALGDAGAGPGRGRASADHWGAGGAGFCNAGGNGGADLTSSATGGMPYGNAALEPLIGGSAGGGGGAGGGAIQLIAGTEVRLATSGVIHVGGGGTSFGRGGGSGGAILIEAPNVVLGGTLASNGGAGGGWGGVPSANASPDSIPARGSYITDAAYGGSGSAGLLLGGQPGGRGENDWYGGGGGAAGRIRINSRSGTVSVGTLVSPAAATECVTQGTLRE